MYFRFCKVADEYINVKLIYHCFIECNMLRNRCTMSAIWEYMPLMEKVFIVYVTKVSIQARILLMMYYVLAEGS